MYMYRFRGRRHSLEPRLSSYDPFTTFSPKGNSSQHVYYLNGSRQYLRQPDEEPARHYHSGRPLHWAWTGRFSCLLCKSLQRNRNPSHNETHHACGTLDSKAKMDRALCSAQAAEKCCFKTTRIAQHLFGLDPSTL